MLRGGVSGALLLRSVLGWGQPAASSAHFACGSLPISALIPLTTITAAQRHTGDATSLPPSLPDGLTTQPWMHPAACPGCPACRPPRSTHQQPGNMKHHMRVLPFGLRGMATTGATPTASDKATPQTAPPEATVEDSTVVRALGPRHQGGSYADGYVAPHASMRQLPEDCKLVETFKPRPTYDLAYLESISPTHQPPKDLADRMGLMAVKLMRWSFDVVTGYGPNMTEAKWLRRMIFLETVAGVPGMVAGMLRHLHSLRTMRRDMGWIPCLLEEAENERMHLLTFMEIRKPGPLFRAMVVIAQGVFFNMYFIVYLMWPKFCHSFVGYLEEEAVRTYTHALRDIDEGKLWVGTPAPGIARVYWNLDRTATMRDVILSVRADEACHSHVNHTLKAVPPTELNPFASGKSHLP